MSTVPWTHLAKRLLVNLYNFSVKRFSFPISLCVMKNYTDSVITGIRTCFYSLRSLQPKVSSSHLRALSLSLPAAAEGSSSGLNTR